MEVYINDKSTEYIKAKRLVFLYFMNIEIPKPYDCVISSLFNFLKAGKSRSKKLGTTFDYYMEYVSDKKILYSIVKDGDFIQVTMGSVYSNDVLYNYAEMLIDKEKNYVTCVLYLTVSILHRNGICFTSFYI